MAMFSRFSRRFKAGWVFGGEALALVKQHPKLLVFPLLSSIAFVAILAQAFFVSAPAATMWMQQFSTEQADDLWPTMYTFTLGWFFLSYVLLWIAAIFLNTALCGSVLAFHSTGKMSLRTGLALATKRIPQIIGWALFASTIGLLLSWITSLLQDYLSWAGWLLGSLVEAAWSVSVYFVTPLLAAEGIGPVDAAQRSMGLIKKQWGQMVGSEFSVFWRLWPLHLVGLACLVGVFALPIDLPRIACGLGLLGYVIISSALQNLMSGIVCTNLYRFAATGATPAGNQAAYQAAFRSKK
jgi:hypothetical protein